jgi:hypothetical protein
MLLKSEEFYLLGYTATKSVENQLIFQRSIALLAASFMLIFCFSYSSILKMEATCFSKTMAGFQLIAWRDIPETELVLNTSV